MDMICFYEWFPEVSEAETLTISLTEQDAAAYGLPAAQYFCVEHICPNPDCDCREVLLRVVGDCFTGSVAHLRVSACDDGEPRVSRDDEAQQTQYADKVARLLTDRLAGDRRLAEQLTRHYELVKKRAARENARRQFLSDESGKVASGRKSVR